MSERLGPATEERIEELLRTMTLDEKVGLCHGCAQFAAGGVERLGIPELVMSDGPHGVRRESRRDSFDAIDGVDDAVTYLPVEVALAATWNPERAADFGDVLGAEARERGKDVILGPGVNLVRTPLCGRNFEYLSEDPCLIAAMVEPLVRAIQAHDVAACVKHFACNNQELDRRRVDVDCDEATLRELYLPGFAAAVRAGVLTVMGAYNRFRGRHCCHHDYLLERLLKGEWGFRGAVISDWGGVHDDEEAVRGGLDVEMGGSLDSHHLDRPFAEGLRAGRYHEALLDDKARRCLRVRFAIGAFDPGRRRGERNTPRHRTLARRIADECLVLLANDGLLPLDPAVVRRLAVIGENADAVHAAGGGSSGIRAFAEVTPLAALREAYGTAMEIEFVHGYPCAPGGLVQIPSELLAAVDDTGIGAWRLEFFAGRRNLETAHRSLAVPTVDLACAGAPRDDLEPGDWAARWRGTVVPPAAGTYRLVVHGGDNWQLYLDGRNLASAWDLTVPATEVVPVELEADRSYAIELRLQPKAPGGCLRFGWVAPGAAVDADPHAAAEAAARRADAVVVVGGCSHRQDCEGQDRKTYGLPGGQDALIERVLAANPRTAVVLYGGTAVDLPWADAAPAILQAWYPGTEGGRAVAAALFGAVNPSGKLPISWPRRLEDCAAHALGDYREGAVTYREGPAVGYRWHEGGGPAPRFCFGHGLSYTSFALTDLSVTVADGEVAVCCTVRNTGERAGAEVVQLYLAGNHPDARRPAELKAFAKVHLDPGEERRVALALGAGDMAHYDAQRGAWRVHQGRRELRLGVSSRDVRLSGTFGYPP